MNKLFIGLIVIATIGLGWLLFSDTDKFDYVITVDDEITQLETELAILDSAVEAGTLTSAQATEAKVKIIKRLDTINASITTSGSAKLTPAQQKQLNEGLERLKTILINYQATLSTIDDIADDSVVQAQLKRGKGSSKTLIDALADTVENVEENAEEVIEEYEPNEVLDEQVEAAMDEENIPVEEGEIEDTNSTIETDTDTTVSDTESGEEDTTPTEEFDETPADEVENADETENNGDTEEATTTDPEVIQ